MSVGGFKPLSSTLTSDRRYVFKLLNQRVHHILRSKANKQSHRKSQEIHKGQIVFTCRKKAKLLQQEDSYLHSVCSQATLSVVTFTTSARKPHHILKCSQIFSAKNRNVFLNNYVSNCYFVNFFNKQSYLNLIVNNAFSVVSVKSSSLVGTFTDCVPRCTWFTLMVNLTVN